jgi:type III pantothenate kinase
VLLAIDVGNTQTVLGLLDGPTEDIRVVEHWRVATDARRTADEFMAVLRGLLTDGIDDRITGIAICSTVPAVLHEMREMIARYFASVRTVLVEPGVRTGVPVLMDNPREVGTDRIVNSLAAKHLYGGPCIVVDFGTATTFDVVSAAGEYLGGAIAPGIGVSLDALGDAGAQLRRVELLRQGAAQGGRIEPVDVNGQPGARLLGGDGRLVSVLTLDIADGHIQAMRNVLNPDKLRHLGSRVAEPPAE